MGMCEDHEILRKLDQIILTQQNAEKERAYLASEVQSLVRTLRGTNGDPGLLTSIALMREQLNHIIEDDKTKESADLHQSRMAMLLEKTSFPVDPEKKGGDPEKQTLQIVKSWIADNFWLPITVAFLIYLFTKLLPELTKLLATN